MARNRYRMTPRRRAALKKAQAASARKRRRTRAKRVGGAVVGVGVLGASGVAGHFGGKHVQQWYRRRHKTKALDVVRVTHLGRHTGKPISQMHGVPVGKATDDLIKAFDKGHKKEWRKARQRARRKIYDLNSRREYWQQKPALGRATGRTRKNPRTGKREIHKRARRKRNG